MTWRLSWFYLRSSSCRHACHQFSVNLESGCALCRALFHTRQRQADLAYSVEVNCAPVFFEVLICFGDLPAAFDPEFDVRAPGTLPIRGSPASTTSHFRSAADQSQAHRLVGLANPLPVYPILESPACLGTRAAALVVLLSSGEPYAVIRSIRRLIRRINTILSHIDCKAAKHRTGVRR